MNLRRQFDGLLVLQVADSCQQNGDILPTITDEVIAGAAQQPANCASGMVVVDVESASAAMTGCVRRETADTALAALGFEHLVVVGESDAVLSHQICGLVPGLNIGGGRSLGGFLSGEYRELHARTPSGFVVRAARLVFKHLAGAEFFLAVRAWAKNPTSWAKMLGDCSWLRSSPSFRSLTRITGFAACVPGIFSVSGITQGEGIIRKYVLASRARLESFLDGWHGSAVAFKMSLQGSPSYGFSTPFAGDGAIGF